MAQLLTFNPAETKPMLQAGVGCLVINYQT